jgi:hypothetical protein
METETHEHVAAAHDFLHQWPFQCLTFDALLVMIAKSITHAALHSASTETYFCANSEGTGSSGFHWVAAILTTTFPNVPVVQMPDVHGFEQGADALQNIVDTDSDDCVAFSNNSDSEPELGAMEFEQKATNRMLRFSLDSVCADGSAAHPSADQFFEFEDD